MRSILPFLLLAACDVSNADKARIGLNYNEELRYGSVSYKLDVLPGDDYITYTRGDSDFFNGADICLTGRQFVIGEGWQVFASDVQGEDHMHGFVRWPKPTTDKERGPLLRLKLHKCGSNWDQSLDREVQFQFD